MLGRAAYSNPYLLAGVDELFFGVAPKRRTRMEVLNDYMEYCASQLDRGVPLRRLTRHIVGLFQGCRGARAWRRTLSENAHRPGADLAVIERAAAMVTDDALEPNPRPGVRLRNRRNSD
jgi:tRNA-dihydrouridine synthase A